MPEHRPPGGLAANAPRATQERARWPCGGGRRARAPRGARRQVAFRQEACSGAPRSRRCSGCCTRGAAGSTTRRASRGGSESGGRRPQPRSSPSTRGCRGGTSPRCSSSRSRAARQLCRRGHGIAARHARGALLRASADSLWPNVGRWRSGADRWYIRRWDWRVFFPVWSCQRFTLSGSKAAVRANLDISPAVAVWNFRTAR